MDREYWGEEVDPEEDDFDLWLCIPEEEEEPDGGYDDGYDDEDTSLDEDMAALKAVLDELGPAIVLEVVAGYLYELERPFHRAARQAHQLAERIYRAEGAVEEAHQTRGIKTEED